MIIAGTIRQTGNSSGGSSYSGTVGRDPFSCLDGPPHDGRKQMSMAGEMTVAAREGAAQRSWGRAQLDCCFSCLGVCARSRPLPLHATRQSLPPARPSAGVPFPSTSPPPFLPLPQRSLSRQQDRERGGGGRGERLEAPCLVGLEVT